MSLSERDRRRIIKAQAKAKIRPLHRSHNRQVAKILQGVLDDEGSTPDPSPLLMATDFLTLDGGPLTGLRSHNYPMASPKDRAEVRAALKARGYNTIVIEVHHLKLDKWTPKPFSFYANSGSIVSMTALIKEAKADGLQVLLMLGIGNDKTMGDTDQVKRWWDAAIPKWVAAEADIFLACLEMDEVWDGPAMEMMLAHLGFLVGDQVLATHMGTGLRPSTAWEWDWHVHQYGFNQTEEFIESETRRLVSEIRGRVLIGGEWAVLDTDKPPYPGATPISEAESMKLGAAPIRGGAQGVMNGILVKGTGGGGLDLSEVNIVQHGAQDIASWPVTTDFVGRFEGDHLVFEYDPPASWAEVGPKKVVSSIWLAFEIGGKMWGDPVEYMRRVPTPRGPINEFGIEHPGHGLVYPRSGDEVWVWLSSVARRGYLTADERTEPIKVIWP